MSKWIFYMSLKNVEIEPGCISCGSCEFLVPEVFKVMVTSQVKHGVDYEKFAERIKEAAAKCPVQVIKIKEKL